MIQSQKTCLYDRPRLTCERQGGDVELAGHFLKLVKSWRAVGSAAFLSRKAAFSLLADADLLQTADAVHRFPYQFDDERRLGKESGRF